MNSNNSEAHGCGQVKSVDADAIVKPSRILECPLVAMSTVAQNKPHPATTNSGRAAAT